MRKRKSKNVFPLQRCCTFSNPNYFPLNPLNGNNFKNTIFTVSCARFEQDKHNYNRNNCTNRVQLRGVDVTDTTYIENVIYSTQHDECSLFTCPAGGRIGRYIAFTLVRPSERRGIWYSVSFQMEPADRPPVSPPIKIITIIKQSCKKYRSIIPSNT